ncbi:MAG: hypothetical protein RR365_01160 [Bacteroides sp.]
MDRLPTRKFELGEIVTVEDDLLSLDPGRFCYVEEMEIMRNKEAKITQVLGHDTYYIRCLNEETYEHRSVCNAYYWAGEFFVQGEIKSELSTGDWTDMIRFCLV